MYMGGSTLLTLIPEAPLRSRLQAINEFCTFSSVTPGLRPYRLGLCPVGLAGDFADGHCAFGGIVRQPVEPQTRPAAGLGAAHHCQPMHCLNDLKRQPGFVEPTRIRLRVCRVAA